MNIVKGKKYVANQIIFIGTIKNYLPLLMLRDFKE